ncbi:hypothetical protein BCR37DRAFT_394127 [Protomyces lactucae-debilis]|uniref:Uncharacterized protein n=1 Tax=Protomyces lactucae-debilis TaxID=2754530 RepID=A0A1Y2F658_PROLT|nr:uncharacterized protein BCR37DRAFT_394127 [Protomyces lactucae-debilis]ORY79390.1 hypothetical protein BCR37DRAFT_394127 [Protomyces lactucae-debilis]
MPKIKKDNARGVTATSSKNKKARPETCEDFIDLASDLEESGDRWVQQPDKSHRFYLQAAEAYDTAVNLDSANADAAYNAARLPLVMAQNCALLATQQIELLERAADAHRSFLSRWTNHVDAKFNLATVLLLSIELVTTHEVLVAMRNDDVIEKNLLQAMELLESCREVQTAELAKMAEDDETAPANAPDAAMDETEEAQDVNYITPDILLDTLIAMADAYSNMLDASIAVQHLETTRQYILTQVGPQAEAILPRCADPNEAASRWQDVQRSVQLSELSCAHEHGSLSLMDWKSSLEEIIANGPATLEAACSYSDACIDLAKAMQAEVTDEATLQEVWKVYTAGAAAQLSAAVQLATAAQSRRPDVWVSRADIELLRSNIGSKTSLKNQQVLRTNAKVYYKRAVAECLPKHIRTQREAALKLAVVSAELGDVADHL